MKIFLIGFMGCGKTTTGKKLARLLSYPFFDLDKVIEEKIGQSIPDYFKHHGEESFRKLESEMLQSHFPERNMVISTGGGTPCFYNNMEWMNAHGTTIYIMLSPRALASRLKYSTDRPLIQNLKGEELVNFIEHKLAEREPFYKKARFLVDGLNLTAERLASYFR